MKKTILIFLSVITWSGCGPGDLEIEGLLQRVVGERVTFNLKQGEPGFSGAVILQELIGEKKGQEYKTDRLKVKLEQEHTLSLVIPPGIVNGDADALLEHSDRKGFYSIPLSINRLLLARTEKGALEIVPLLPASLEKSVVSFRMPILSVSLAPTGGEAAILSEMQLQFLTLGKEPKKLFDIEYTGGTTLTALADGVLLCTNTSLVLFRLKEQQVTQNAISIRGCKAVAADTAGKMAVVLHSCDSNGDQQFESDCITRINIGEALSVAGAAVILDGEVSAVAVDMTRDGSGIVVPDTHKIYGIYYNPSPTVTEISWDGKVLPGNGTPVQPSGIDHTRVIVGTRELDEFLVAEVTQNRLIGMAFDPDQKFALKRISEITLSVKPQAISLGEEQHLYIADGNKVYRLAAPFNTAVLTPIDLGIAANITALAVQP